MKLRVTRTDQPSSDRVSIIVPVLNEVGRIERCLAALNSQPEEVSEILVVDGGSSDGTQEIIHRFASRDARVRLIDASPIDPRWTGKAWGLNFGLQLTSPASQWILTLDADVEDPRGPLPAGEAFTIDDVIDFHFRLEDERYIREFLASH